MDKPLLVISNSSPIMSMAITGQLNLIHDLFGEILIPKQVWDELVTEEVRANPEQIISKKPNG